MAAPSSDAKRPADVSCADEATPSSSLIQKLTIDRLERIHAIEFLEDASITVGSSKSASSSAPAPSSRIQNALAQAMSTSSLALTGQHVLQRVWSVATRASTQTLGGDVHALDGPGEPAALTQAFVVDIATPLIFIVLAFLVVGVLLAGIGQMWSSRSADNSPPKPTSNRVPPEHTPETKAHRPMASMPSRTDEPPAASILSSQSSVANATASKFCPRMSSGYVVPRGSECILAVRPAGNTRVKWGHHPGAVAVDILDTKGSPVLHGEVIRPVMWPDTHREIAWLATRPSFPPALTLRASNGPVAMCYPNSGPDRRRQMHIYNAKGLLFACITWRKELECYMLSTVDDDSHVTFEGNFTQYKIKVSNQHQFELASTEPCNMEFDSTSNFYRLSIAAGSDVSLILCSLMAIEEMENRGVEGKHMSRD